MNFARDVVAHPGFHRLGWALLHFVWQGGLVALGLAGLLLLLRRHTPRVRWAVSCAALALMAVLPLVTAWRLDVGPPMESVRPALSTTGEARTPPVTFSTQPAAEPIAVTAGPAGVAPANPSTPSASFLSRLEESVAPHMPVLLVLWLFGVAGMSVWHVGGWLRVRRLLRLDLCPAPPCALECLSGLLERQPLRRAVRLMESLRVHGPLVAGVLRPVILLPVGLATGLTPAQLEAVLAHELAHVRRWDGLVLILQAAVETLLFYHPAVWWVSGQIRKESERCCDDLATRVCSDRLLYAETLAEVAARAAGRGVPRFASGVGGGGLLSRVRRLLEAPPERAKGRWPALSGGLLGLALLACLCFFVLPRPDNAEGDPLPPGERLERVMDVVRRFKGAEALGPAGFMEEVVVSGRVLTQDGAPPPEGVNLYMTFQNISSNLPVDAGGRFEYRAPAPPGDRHGPVHLAVTSPLHRGQSQVFDLPPDGRLEELEFVLEPGKTLTLWFVDERDGTPLEGVRVVCKQLLGGPLVELPYRGAELRSDAAGRVVIPRVNPDLPLQVTARAPGFERNVRQHLWRQGLDSQGVPMVGEGVAWNPEGGWRWPLTPALPLAGRVVDSQGGAPVEGAEILLIFPGQSGEWPNDPKHTPVAVTGSDGRFLLDSLEREVPHVVFVRAEGRAGRMIQGVQAGGPALEVALPPPLHIRGRIRGDLDKLERDRNGRPILRYGYSLSLPNGNSMSYGRHVPVDVGNGGTFLISDLWPHEWHLRLGEHEAQPQPLNQFTLEDTPLESVELHLDDIPPRAGTRRVVIRLVPPEGHPPPAGYVAVSYIQQRGTRRLVNAQHAAAGEIQFEAVVGERLEITTRDMVGYSFRASPGVVPAGDGPHVVEIPLQPAGVVYGRILPPPGEEETFRPGGFRVSVIGESHHIHQPVDDEGRFLLGPLPLGDTFRIHATREQMLLLSEPVTMTANAPAREINLQAVTGVTVSGNVTHARTGLPLADTRVVLSTDFEPGRSINLQTLTTGPGGRFETRVNPTVPFPYRVMVWNERQSTTRRIVPGEELHIEVDPFPEAVADPIPREQSHPELIELMQKLEVSAPGAREALYSRIEARLPAWYRGLDVEPPDTSESGWVAIVAYDLMPDDLFHQRVEQTRELSKNVGLPFPAEMSRRELLSHLESMVSATWQQRAPHSEWSPGVSPAQIEELGLEGGTLEFAFDEPVYMLRRLVKQDGADAKIESDEWWDTVPAAQHRISVLGHAPEHEGDARQLRFRHEHLHEQGQWIRYTGFTYDLNFKQDLPKRNLSLRNILTTLDQDHLIVDYTHNESTYFKIYVRFSATRPQDPEEPAEANAGAPHVRAYPNLLSSREVMEVQRALTRIKPGMKQEEVMAILRETPFKHAMLSSAGGPLNGRWTLYDLRHGAHLRLTFDHTGPEPIFLSSREEVDAWPKEAGDPSSGRIADPIPREQSHPELIELMQKLEASAPGAREALYSRIEARLPAWYRGLDVEPPDTSESGWVAIVAYDLMPDDLFH